MIMMTTMMMMIVIMMMKTTVMAMMMTTVEFTTFTIQQEARQESVDHNMVCNFGNIS